MGRTRANRTIQGTCSVEGINQIVEELRRYRDHLPQLQERFVRRLASRGYEVARAYIQYAEMTADSDKPIGTLELYTDPQGMVTSCSLVYTGNQVLFVEFGAGIAHNRGKPHPKAGQFGYGVGTYPNQVHAFDPDGWYYSGVDGRSHHTKGTEATMPMFNASEQMKLEIVAIAKEVFSSVI